MRYEQEVPDVLIPDTVAVPLLVGLGFPGMAAVLGTIVFVVIVVGGLGSLFGAFVASLLIGMLQTFAVAVDYSLNGANVPIVTYGGENDAPASQYCSTCLYDRYIQFL